MTEINSRERMDKILNFEVVDRIGMLDAFWPETIKRWHQEGLPEDIYPSEYFDFDVNYQIILDTSFMLKEEVLEETGEYRIISDSNGVIGKHWKGKTGVPYPLDFRLKTRKDWLELKSLLQLNKKRINIIHWGEYELEKTLNESAGCSWRDKQRKYKEVKEENKFILFQMPGPYESMVAKQNTTRLLLSLVEEPELVKDMFSAIAQLIIDSYKLLEDEGMRVGGIFICDDLAYTGGMLFSPKLYMELLFPHHKRICDFFRERGLPVIYHTDGKLDEALPILIEAGITGIQPLEVKAGNDVRELKKRYGNKLVFMGNIDVMKMGRTKKDVEEEIKDKILVAKEGGGYIFHSDHSIPPSVSFENYKYVIELVKEYGKY